MYELSDAMMQNLPGLLARDLAEQQNGFQARNSSSRSRTPADHPMAVESVYREPRFHSPPPSPPRRNPSRVSHRFHQEAGPETFLCSLKQNSVESAWRSEREAILKNEAVCHSSPSLPSRTPRRHYQHHHHYKYVSSPRNRKHSETRAHMKQGTDQDAKRLFLNGMDEGWGSDSSVDMETGLSSPSVRTRKQSITTAATSVDFQLSSGEMGMDSYSAELSAGEVHGTDVNRQAGEHATDGYHLDNYSTARSPAGSPVDSPEKQAAWQAWNEGGSWVDLGEYEIQIGEERGGADRRRYGRRIQLPRDAHSGQMAHHQSQAHNGDQPNAESNQLSYGQEGQEGQESLSFYAQGGQSSHGELDDPGHAQGEMPSHIHNGLSSHTQTELLSQIQGGGSTHQVSKAESAQCTMEHQVQEEDGSTSDPKPAPVVPLASQRRSSLSDQVTALIMEETAPLRKHSRHGFLQRSSPPSPTTLSHHLPFQQHSRTDWDGAEAAMGPIVPTGRHPAHHNLQLDLSVVSPDELSLPPLSVTESRHHDRSHHDRSFSLRSQQQQPKLLTKPRKSHSISKMPLRNVQNWLESSSRARQHSPSFSTASPVAISPTCSVRVSGQVLESLRINVLNFPDTMLRTSSVTINQIRDYSHKVKRSDTARQLVPALESDEHATVLAASPSSPTSPTLGRKTSFTNFKSNLRGKLSRLTNSSTSPSLLEQIEPGWPPIDDSTTATVHCDSPPLSPFAARDAACINALRCILRRASPYLLDALYAHIIAYNYIDSLCSSLPEHDQHGHGQRTRQTNNVVLPAGVTSLADLRVQEDASDMIVKEFQDDVVGVASKRVVPSKAASLLGLGLTSMDTPTKPSQGGREYNKTRKPSSSSCVAVASRGHYLESDTALRSLLDEIKDNIKRLVDTAESCSSGEVTNDSEEVQDSNIVHHNGKEQLDPLFMRAISELVRSYEELSC